MKNKHFFLLIMIFILNSCSAFAVDVKINKHQNKGKAVRGEYCIDFEYPQIKSKNKKVDKKINKYFKRYHFKFSNLTSCAVNIKYKSDVLLSFLMDCFEEVQLDGAAHGHPVPFGEVFNIKTGEKLYLKDLFQAKSNYEKNINPIIKQRIDKSHYQYKAEFAGIKGDETFYITSDSLVIIYPEYLYTSYAESPLIIKIPIDRIKEELKPEYKELK